MDINRYDQPSIYYCFSVVSVIRTSKYNRQVLDKEDLRHVALLRLLRFQYVHIDFFFIGKAKNWYANKIKKQGYVAICLVFLPSTGMNVIQEALMNIILINWFNVHLTSDCTLSTVCDLHVSVNKTSLLSYQSVHPLPLRVQAGFNHAWH